MTEMIKKIIVDILTAFYQPFNFAVVLAILFMFLYLFAREHGWREVFRQWRHAFRSERGFRRIFFLAFYTALILFRTLLNRELWENPLSNVIGVWGIYNGKGELTAEAIENFVLFIPFIVLLFWSLPDKALGEDKRFGRILWRAVEITFLFSLTIECLQLLLRLGTFQLADLAYNTLGGLVGGLIYGICYKAGRRG